MENKPLVSIIIPIYNVEKYIDECITSCLSQTYCNIEIIVINDGSIDNSGSIVDRYAAMDNRITQFRQENKGIPLTRIAGIEATKGDYIMFVDGDDFIVNTIVEIMIDEAIRNNAQMVFSDAYRWSDNGERSSFIINTKKANINNGIDYLEAQIHNYLWAKLYKREVMIDLITQSVNMFDDYFFNLQILPRCKKVVYLEKKLYFYRYNPASVVNDNSTNLSKQYLEHSIQRMAIIEQGEYTKIVKDSIIYDNITTIHRCFIFLEYNERVKRLIDLTYERYKFPLTDFKHLKMGFFLIIAKFTPQLAHFIHQFNRKKRHEN